MDATERTVTLADLRSWSKSGTYNDVNQPLIKVRSWIGPSQRFMCGPIVTVDRGVNFN